MNSICREITIDAPLEKVFSAYVEHIDSWWPREGLFRYSFAPETTAPKQIRFEAHEGGRFYETFADGSEYVIGRIVTWAPPDQLVYTWRAPDWPVETTIEISFSRQNGATLMQVQHSGFGQNGIPAIGAGYGSGLEADVLPAFKQWVEGLSMPVD